MVLLWLALVSSEPVLPISAQMEATVRDFIAAHNARDFATIRQALSPTVRWYAVNGAAVSVEGEGAESIADWRRLHLSVNCPSCRSELLSAVASGRYVTTVELASWTNSAGRCVRQTSPAVYELDGLRIGAVWYFPASAQESCEPLQYEPLH